MLKKYAETTARNGLRLRDAPGDGDTIEVLGQHSRLEILGSETWYRVQTEDGKVGFVHGDYLAPLEIEEPAPNSENVEQLHGRTFYTSGRFSGKELIIDKAFEPAVQQLDTWLAKCNLYMHVTSSLRKPDQAVGGAIVQPSKMSNHFVGHAIDMNLFTRNTDGSTDQWFNSSKMLELEAKPLNGDPNSANEYVTLFLQQLSLNTPLRWGGKFRTPDPVHIDDALNINDKTTYAQLYSTMWG